MSTPKLQTIKLQLQSNGVLIMTFDRPGGNAMSPELFKDWLCALQFANSSADVKVVLQTGAGKFYSSGKDLGPTMHESFEEEMNREMDVLEELINTLINCRKPLIAAVNGPAIGLGVTSLAHYDFVFAAPSATFTVPFMRWNFCAECCSSVLFPKLLGKHLANDLLLAGTSLTANDLASVGFLNVVDSSKLLETAIAKANVLASFDPDTVAVTRDLSLDGDRQALVDVNHRELSKLRQMMMRPGSRQAIQDFVDLRKKNAAARKEKSRL